MPVLHDAVMPAKWRPFGWLWDRLWMPVQHVMRVSREEKLSRRLSRGSTYSEMKLGQGVCSRKQGTKAENRRQHIETLLRIWGHPRIFYSIFSVLNWWSLTFVQLIDSIIELWWILLCSISFIIYMLSILWISNFFCGKMMKLWNY